MDVNFRSLRAGARVPDFWQASTATREFSIATAAGRYSVLCFFATTNDFAGRRALSFAWRTRRYYDDIRMRFFGICLDPRDEMSGSLPRATVGIHWIWDYDGSVSRLLGAIPRGAMPGDDACPVRRFWLLIDPSLHIIAVFPFVADASEERTLAHLLETVHGLAPWSPHFDMVSSNAS